MENITSDMARNQIAAEVTTKVVNPDGSVTLTYKQYGSDMSSPLYTETTTNVTTQISEGITEIKVYVTSTPDPIYLSYTETVETTTLTAEDGTIITMVTDDFLE